jgi:hypothetical protein
MEEISVPKPQQTDYLKTEEATEQAFITLITAATKMGLKITPPMGLMYLPDQAVTRQFQDACRAVLASLAPGVTTV